MKPLIKKNDMVEVIAGAEKGKKGKIVRVIPEKGLVVVEKIKIVKRHARPSSTHKGGIIEREASIHVSNVMLVCAKCKRPGRVGRRTLADGKKARFCRNCGELFEA